VLAELEDSAKLPDEARGDWREEAMTSLARWMRQIGLSAAAILTVIHIENKARCNPPLPDADLWRIINDVVAGRRV
jgi:hypothetical protein